MGQLPNWSRGKLVECFRCGYWYPERDGRIMKKDGRWICVKDNDSLTDLERQKALKK